MHRDRSDSSWECEVHWGAVQHHQGEPGEEAQQDLEAAGGVERDDQENKFIQETNPDFYGAWQGPVGLYYCLYATTEFLEDFCSGGEAW